MKITGLTIGSGDRLWDQLKPDPKSAQKFQEHARRTLQFLRYLETIDGPDLWVRTSHYTLCFSTRDKKETQNEVPHVACVDITFGHLHEAYMISYPLPREMRPWMKGHSDKISIDCWKVSTHQRSKEAAASALLGAIAVSGANPERPQAEWMWYICPNCDLHSPHYKSRCERCAHAVPSQKKMELLGLYRKAHLPEEYVAPTEAQADTTQKKTEN